MNMKKMLVTGIMMVFAAILFFGSSIAYYNTKSFGFDEDAIFYKRTENSIIFLDKEIKYEEGIKKINNEVDKDFFRNYIKEGGNS